MKSKFMIILRKIVAVVMLVQMFGLFLPISSVKASAEVGKIRICHATGSGYNNQDISSNGTDVGHSRHADDIIPPNPFHPDGVNWGSGLSVWLNNCNEEGVTSFGVVYDGNGSTSGSVPVDANIYSSGATVTTLGNTGLLQKPGYSFSGWNTLSNGSGTSFSVGDTFNISHNTILYAQWIRGSYTVSFEVNGGTPAPVGQTVLGGGSVAEPATPTKTGYSFGGWYRDIELTSLWNFGSDTVTSNMTLYAKWNINSYLVSFDSAGGTPVLPEVVNYGGLVTVPTDPTKLGYAFNEWHLSPTISSPWLFLSDTVGSNLTLYAHWLLNSYNAFFVVDGNTTAVPTGYGEPIVVPADPAKPGYTFVGWTPQIPETMPANDLTFQANWEINSYTISFDSAGGTPVAPITQVYGSAIIAPTNPVRSGYTFAGWTPSLPGTMPSENMLLVAQWTPAPPGAPTVITPPIITLIGAATTGLAPLTGPTTIGDATSDVPEPTIGEVKGAENSSPVLGSSNKTCPWWWIVSLISLVVLAFVGGVVKMEKDDSIIRSYYYLWPILIGGVAWVAHYYLHKGFASTWFCENYWLIAALLVVVAEFVYRFLAKSKDDNR